MSIYGEYRTRTFGEIFPTLESFQEYYESNAIPARLLTSEQYESYNITAIYSLLISEYFGSHIAMSSEDWFKLKVMQTIYEYGPQWQREMYLQDKLLNLTDSDIKRGGKAIYNHAMHPSTQPSTDTLEELTYIDDQNTTNYKKEDIKAYQDAAMGLDDNITNKFIRRFRKLFLRFVYPTGPIYYSMLSTEGD